MSIATAGSRGGTSALGVLSAPRGFWWGVFAALWTLQVALYAVVSYYGRRSTADAISWREAIVASALDWYLWAAICLVCLWLARRLSLDRYRWRSLIPAFIGWGIVVTLGRGVLDYVILAALGWEQMPLAERLVVTFPGRFILFVLFLGVGYGVDYAKRHRDREIGAANLRAELANAQLQMLKVQLHPHFLFNTLHAISSLMYTDVAAADRMLVRLSELLRRTLQAMDTQKVDLAEELSFLDLYLEIEQARLGQRLKVVMEIDPATSGALVPHLILQPLVENAIRHGIAPKVSGGTLTVASALSSGDFILTVRDDGLGFAADQSAGGQGVGLTNTQSRLEQMYGAAAQMNIKEPQEGGAEIRITIPFEIAEDAEGGGPMGGEALSQTEQAQEVHSS